MNSNIATQDESLATNAKLHREGILTHAIQSQSSSSEPSESCTDGISFVSEVEIPLAEGEDAERERSASQRLEKVLQLLPVGVVMLDSRGQVSDCNPAAAELLGGQLKGASWREIINDKFHPRLDDGHEISLKNGKRISLVTRSLGDEPGQLIVLNDLTETRELQQQLSRHQRLSAMGKMISSLAHQIRTPLSAALLYAGNLKASNSDDYTVARYSEKMQSRLQNIERQIRDMLIFARGESELRDEISVTELVRRLREAAADLQHPNSKSLIWKVTANSARLTCNSDSLSGALLNLIENALHASGESQSVTINVGLTADGSKQSEPCLRIAVEDEGIGIDACLMDKLEEPFVTTKSQGTGLGLAIVKLVTQAHQGKFSLKNRPNKGVCAEIVLPVNTGGRQ